MDMGLLLAFVAAAALISIVPGPDMLYIMATGMSSGPRAGVLAALGMSTGVVCHTAAAVLGLSALLHAVPVALEAIRVVGVAFLAYLAVSAWRSSRAGSDGAGLDAPGASSDAPAGGLRVRRIYAMAVLTNVSNPKVVLFYVAFVPQFTSAGAAWPLPAQLLTLGAVLIVVGLSVDATVGLAAGRLSDLMLRRPAVRRGLDRGCAVVFGGLAARLALTDPVSPS
jgi:threonine/homoserine/homoserine lactone efflux protein